MSMSEEEAKANARVIVDQFDMSLRDHGGVGYRNLERLIQAALIEASTPKATDTLAIAQWNLAEALAKAEDEKRYWRDRTARLITALGHAQDHIASGRQENLDEIMATINAALGNYIK